MRDRFLVIVMVIGGVGFFKGIYDFVKVVKEKMF